ncbi:hypothetical protein [Nocardia terpenica]|uniref:Uncharacterized protein n=1 Tax=Nocardia terpenica TaxID=455432 RepID=A0A164PMJ9_9NOCA|nr:hypothetical protein [Nocardia terpenica]KZM75776.1 hypothetical protein AWN90_20790 [Nocardia terpenica]NQE86294.1 hypothetical protein [Nocardia terpenica]
MRHIGKAVEFDAIQYTSDNLPEINRALAGRQSFTTAGGLREYPSGAYPAVYLDPDVSAELWSQALQVWLPVRLGDWIIRGPDGELDVCPQQAFAARYQAAH